MSPKPLTLFATGQSPNPIKVAILLEELDLPYTVISVPFQEIKTDPHLTSINPNARLPALEDPNTGVAMFESGAILEYLIDTYDKEHKFTYAYDGDEKVRWLEKSWLHLQMSGQGPYFGQLAWFQNYHPEKNITSAIDRYTNELKRVSRVIDTHLSKHNYKTLLGGDKVSYVDLAWIPWYKVALGWLLKGQWDYKAELPAFATWIDGLIARESVGRVYAKKEFPGFH